jgi:hypothetical protein
VLAAPSIFYFAIFLKLKGIIGLWPDNKKLLIGLDPDVRLNTAPYIWKNLKEVRNRKDTERLNTIKSLKNMKALYDEIVARCKLEKIISIFFIRGFRQAVSKFFSPELRIALGIFLVSNY